MRSANLSVRPPRCSPSRRDRSSTGNIIARARASLSSRESTGSLTSSCPPLPTPFPSPARPLPPPLLPVPRFAPLANNRGPPRYLTHAARRVTIPRRVDPDRRKTVEIAERRGVPDRAVGVAYFTRVSACRENRLISFTIFPPTTPADLRIAGTRASLSSALMHSGACSTTDVGCLDLFPEINV